MTRAQLNTYTDSVTIGERVITRDAFMFAFLRFQSDEGCSTDDWDMAHAWRGFVENKPRPDIEGVGATEQTVWLPLLEAYL